MTPSILAEYVIPIVLFVGVVSGVFNLKSKNRYAIFFYLSLSLAIDMTSRFLSGLQSNNLILFSFLSFLEIVVFSYMYWEKLKNAWWLQVLIVAGLIYIVFEAITLDTSDLANYQTYARNVSSILIVLMALNYIFSELRAGSTLKGDTLHFVLLFYYSLEFMLLIPFNFLINASTTSIMYIWTARVILLFIFYSYLTYYLWSSGKTQK